MDEKKELEKIITETKAALDVATKKLADLEKPKLRHGNCYHDGSSYVVVIKKEEKWLFVYDDGGYTEMKEADIWQRIKACRYAFTGANIFSDMKRKAKDGN